MYFQHNTDFVEKIFKLSNVGKRSNGSAYVRRQLRSGAQLEEGGVTQLTKPYLSVHKTRFRYLLDIF